MQLCFHSFTYNYLLFFKISSLVAGGDDNNDDDIWIIYIVDDWVYWVVAILSIISAVGITCAAVYGCLYTKQKEALKDALHEQKEMEAHQEFQLAHQREQQDSPPVMYAGDVTVVLPQNQGHTNNTDIFQQGSGGSSTWIHTPYEKMNNTTF